MSEKGKKDWIVRVRCTVTKDVYCENCTLAEARDEPFEHAVGETEVDREDWTVLTVEDNA